MIRLALVLLTLATLASPALAKKPKKRKKKKKSKATLLFKVTEGRKSGYVNTKGKLVVPLKYRTAYPFSEGLARVGGDYAGFIDTKGKAVIGVESEGPGRSYGDFSEGLAGFRDKEGKWGFIDTSGKVVIEAKWNGVEPFSEGLAVVQLEGADSYGIGKRGYVDATGKLVIKGPYNEALPFREGLAAVNTAGVHGKWGYIDKKGRMKIKPQFHRAWSFYEGLARALKEPAANWGAINKKGKFVIGPGVTLRDADSGVVCVHDAKGWRIFSTRGKPVTDVLPVFALDGHTEGLAVFEITSDRTKPGKLGYMNTKGKIVIKPTFDQAFPFKNGMAKAKIGETEVLINKRGKIVWRAKKR